MNLVKPYRIAAGCLSLMLLLLLVSPALAQSVPANATRLRIKLEGEPQPVNSQAYPQLTFNLTAYDSEGLVQNLTKEQIKAAVDDTPVNVVDVIPELNQDTELVVAVLLDTSGSIYGNNASKTNSIPQAKTAIKSFVGKLSNKDRIAILTFNENAEPQTGTAGATDFLTDKNVLYNVIDSIPNESKNPKNTRIFSSLFNTIGDAARQTVGERRVIVILSDGEDTSSGVNDIKLTDVLDRARDKNVMIYAIGLGEEVKNNPTFEQTLKTISALNGGKYSYAATANDLGPLYSEIVRQLKTRYRVTVDAKAVPSDNKEHLLKLSVTTASGDTADLKANFTAFHPITPRIEVAGLDEGKEVNGPLNVSLKIASRYPVGQVEYRIVDSTGKEVANRTVDKEPFTLTNLPTSSLPEKSNYKLNVTVRTVNSTGGAAQAPLSTPIPSPVASSGQPEPDYQTVSLNFSIGTRPTPTESSMWWLWVLLGVTILVIFIIVLVVITSNRKRTQLALETQAMSVFPPAAPTITNFQEPSWSGPSSSTNSGATVSPEFEVRLEGSEQRPGATVMGNSGSGSGSKPQTRTILDEEPELTTAVMVMRGGDQRIFRLKPGRTTVGRDHSHNDIVLTDPTVSNRHAVIDQQGVNFVITDIGSTMGTKVNNIRIEKHVLNTGDIVQLGKTELLFKKA